MSYNLFRYSPQACEEQFQRTEALLSRTLQSGETLTQYVLKLEGEEMGLEAGLASDADWVSTLQALHKHRDAAIVEALIIRQRHLLARTKARLAALRTTVVRVGRRAAA